jgi:hypothetical protein
MFSDDNVPASSSALPMDELLHLLQQDPDANLDEGILKALHALRLFLMPTGHDSRSLNDEQLKMQKYIRNPKDWAKWKNLFFRSAQLGYVAFDTESQWGTRPAELRWLILSTMSGLTLHVDVRSWLRLGAKEGKYRLDQCLPEDFMAMFLPREKFREDDPLRLTGVRFVGVDVKQDIEKALHRKISDRFMDQSLLFDHLVKMGVFKHWREGEHKSGILWHQLSMFGAEGLTKVFMPDNPKPIKPPEAIPGTVEGDKACQIYQEGLKRWKEQQKKTWRTLVGQEKEFFPDLPEWKDEQGNFRVPRWRLLVNLHRYGNKGLTPDQLKYHAHDGWTAIFMMICKLICVIKANECNYKGGPLTREVMEACFEEDTGKDFQKPPLENYHSMFWPQLFGELDTNQNMIYLGPLETKMPERGNQRQFQGQGTSSTASARADPAGAADEPGTLSRAQQKKAETRRRIDKIMEDMSIDDKVDD